MIWPNIYRLTMLSKSRRFPEKITHKGSMRKQLDNESLLMLGKIALAKALVEDALEEISNLSERQKIQEVNYDQKTHAILAKAFRIGSDAGSLLDESIVKFSIVFFDMEHEPSRNEIKG